MLTEQKGNIPNILTEEIIPNLYFCPVSIKYRDYSRMIEKDFHTNGYEVLAHLFAHLARRPNLNRANLLNAISMTTNKLVAYIDIDYKVLRKQVKALVELVGQVYYKGSYIFNWWGDNYIKLDYQAIGNYNDFSRIVTFGNKSIPGIENFYGLLQASALRRIGKRVDFTINVEITSNEFKVTEHSVNDYKINVLNKSLKTIFYLWKDYSKLHNLYNCPTCPYSNKGLSCLYT